KEIQIVKVHEITHPALVQYLSSRGISLITAKAYCKEVWYRFNEKQFFAIGLQNHNNGWELRNKLFKNSSSPKCYTYIKRNSNRLIILEGMSDLLSLAMLDEALLNASDILILNSIAFLKNAEHYIDTYDDVCLYLDRD